jgi:hypothetical protein
LSFAVGSLVKARGREWVVLPESEDDMLILRPLGGTDEEIAGVYLPLETVEPARFDLPDPAQVGDHRSCRATRFGWASALARAHSARSPALESIPGPTSSYRC